MPVNSTIKVNAFAYKASTCLYQMRLMYTNGVESKPLNAQEAASVEGAKVVEMHPSKSIAAVEVSMRPDESNIYGIRFIDSQDGIIAEKTWRRSHTAEWVRIEVPTGYDIIGFHGSHDGNYIRQFGLVLWRPNPQAEPLPLAELGAKGGGGGKAKKVSKKGR